MIIETFYFLFETDASKVADEIDKGVKAADGMAESMVQADLAAGEIVITSEAILAALERVIRESLKLPKGMAETGKAAEGASKKISELDAKTQKLSKSMQGYLSMLARFALGTIAVSGISALTTETAKQNEALRIQADLLKIDVEQLQLWQRSFEAAGSSADVFNGLFEKMRQRSREPIKSIEHLADRFSMLGQRQRELEGRSWGLDNRAIEMLAKGKQGIRELMQAELELGIVTHEQIEQSRKFAEQQRIMNRLWGDVKQRIALMVMPAVTGLFKGISDLINYFRKHESFVKAFFIGIAIGITAFYLPAVIRAMAMTYLWLKPFLAIAAIATLIALIVEDILVYLRGGDSVTGQLAKRWPWIKDVVHGVANFIKFIADKLEALPGVLGHVLDTFMMILGVVGKIFGFVGRPYWKHRQNGQPVYSHERSHF